MSAAAHQVAPLPPIERYAQAAAAALDAVFALRTGPFPYQPAELDAALARFVKARQDAASFIAILSTALHQRADDPVAKAFTALYDLARLDRLGAMVEHGAESLADDVALTATLREFASQFSRDTHVPGEASGPTGNCLDCGSAVYDSETFCNEDCEQSTLKYLDGIAADVEACAGDRSMSQPNLEQIGRLGVRYVRAQEALAEAREGELLTSASRPLFTEAEGAWRAMQAAVRAYGDKVDVPEGAS